MGSKQAAPTNRNPSHQCTPYKKPTTIMGQKILIRGTFRAAVEARRHAVPDHHPAEELPRPPAQEDAVSTLLHQEGTDAATCAVLLAAPSHPEWPVSTNSSAPVASGRNATGRKVVALTP